MRLMDICVAVMIGLSSVAAMLALNPNQLSEQGSVYREQASLSDYLLFVASTTGLPWLHLASPDSVCSAMLSFSNSTVQVSAEGRNFLCSTRPTADVPISSLILVFPEGNLTLLAWRRVAP